MAESSADVVIVGGGIAASRTQPVEEVISDAENGLLVDFFSPAAIAARIDEALHDPMEPLRRRARQTVVEKFDLKRVCLPAQFKLVEDLVAEQSPLHLG